MNEEKRTGERAPEEKPRHTEKSLKVLSTSLGVALAANLLLIPSALGQEAAAPADQAKLVEWSTEEVKKYFDASVDWNIPLPQEKEGEQQGSGSGGAVASGGASSQSPTVIHHGGFGWDDMLLYHLIFNNGRAYSSSGWSTRGGVYDTRTNTPYKTKSFSADAFQNRPVVNSAIRPHTSNGSGSIIRRSSVGGTKSNSSSPGGIGGKSSGFSSSNSSKGGGFGG